MKVVLIDWDSYGDITPAFARRGYTVAKCPWDLYATDAKLIRQLDTLRELLGTKESGNQPDYVFSYNYYPLVSEACLTAEVPYISWIYDSPFHGIYDKSVINATNHIFTFDYGQYQSFAAAGVETVKYLPLGIDAETIQRRCGKVGENVPGAKGYKPSFLNLQTGRVSLEADIAFVGSLYTEPQHRLYDRFAAADPYTKGYLDSVIEAQKHIYGENFIERLLSNDIVAQMEKVCPTAMDEGSFVTPAQVYADYVLSRQVTALERTEILSLLGQRFKDAKKRLYTVDNSVRIDGWKNMGPVEYFNEMPQVFRCSRINLNITLRSILTGLPLRSLDVMAAGGFLISNYQAEITEYFIPGEDLVVYEDYEDLCTKIEYYLSHEAERRDIAVNGCRKVRSEHTIDDRISVMEQDLQ